MNMKWIIGFTFLLVFFGMIMGLTFGGLNPWESPARARAMDIQTDYQRALNDQDLRLKTMQAESVIRDIERKQELAVQLAQEQQIFAQELNQAKLRAYRSIMQSINALIIFFGVSVLVVSSILILMRVFTTIYSAISKNRNINANFSQQTSGDMIDLWKSPEYRRAMRQAAHTTERNHRIKELQSADNFFHETRRIWPEDDQQDTPTKFPWAE